jgi:predicted transcriptional regulator
MGGRLKTIKLSDELSKMLSEIADYMGISESDVIRHLIKKEYMRLQKQKAQVANT